MSQMHLAFVRAHNQFVDRVRSEGTPESNVFESAARELRWHYQMVVLREFLPTLVGADLVRSLLDKGPSFYRPAHEPFIPWSSPTRRIAMGTRRFVTCTR